MSPRAPGIVRPDSGPFLKAAPRPKIQDSLNSGGAFPLSVGRTRALRFLYNYLQQIINLSSGGPPLLFPGAGPGLGTFTF